VPCRAVRLTPATRWRAVLIALELRSSRTALVPPMGSTRMSHPPVSWSLLSAPRSAYTRLSRSVVSSVGRTPRLRDRMKLRRRAKHQRFALCH